MVDPIARQVRVHEPPVDFVQQTGGVCDGGDPCAVHRRLPVCLRARLQVVRGNWPMPVYSLTATEEEASVPQLRGPSFRDPCQLREDRVFTSIKLPVIRLCRSSSTDYFGRPTVRSHQTVVEAVRVDFYSDRQ
jgi:hypothetical protein